MLAPFGVPFADDLSGIDLHAAIAMSGDDSTNALVKALGGAGSFDCSSDCGELVGFFHFLSFFFLTSGIPPVEWQGFSCRRDDVTIFFYCGNNYFHLFSFFFPALILQGFQSGGFVVGWLRNLNQDVFRSP